MALLDEIVSVCDLIDVPIWFHTSGFFPRAVKTIKLFIKLGSDCGGLNENYPIRKYI